MITVVAVVTQDWSAASGKIDTPAADESLRFMMVYAKIGNERDWLEPRPDGYLPYEMG